MITNAHILCHNRVSVVVYPILIVVCGLLFCSCSERSRLHRQRWLSITRANVISNIVLTSLDERHLYATINDTNELGTIMAILTARLERRGNGFCHPVANMNFRCNNTGCVMSAAINSEAEVVFKVPSYDDDVPKYAYYCPSLYTFITNRCMNNIWFTNDHSLECLSGRNGVKYNERRGQDMVYE